VIEPDSLVCPCGCGNMVRIGEDRTERLDYIPARYRVIVAVRPRYACPKGRTGAVQAKAPAHLLEGSWPTEALLAQIAVSKHSEHMPLNRQALAFCWAHGWRKLIKAKPKKGSPVVDEALLRIAALYKVEDAIRGSDPDHRRAVRQELSRPLVDAFFIWLQAQAARVSRKSDLGEAMA